jgi:hypothetical protein
VAAPKKAAMARVAGRVSIDSLSALLRADVRAAPAAKGGQP